MFAIKSTLRDDGKVVDLGLQDHCSTREEAERSLEWAEAYARNESAYYGPNAEIECEIVEVSQ